MADEHLFNKTYSEFIKRNWLFVPNASKQQIVDFLNQNPNCIMKPTRSSKGIGVEKVDSKTVLNGNLDEFISKATEKKCVLEAFICQNKELDAINSTSVNSL